MNRATAPRTTVGARVRVSSSGVRGHQQPRITYGLIGLNVLVFIAVAFQAGSVSTFGRSSIFNESLLIPMAVADDQWWRLVASGFLHLSVTHILLNMLALYFIGIGLERVLGAWRYLALYFLSLLGGSACIMLFADVNSAAAGASGAIFGLMGALLVTLKRLKLDMRQAGIIIAINLIATFAIPGISWQAHVGGLVVGALVGVGIVYAPAVKRTNWQIGICLGVFVALVVVLVTKEISLGAWQCVASNTPGITCRQLA